MSTIAHEMDPTQRAGQTIASNVKGAKKFGRGNKIKKKTSYKHKSKNLFLKLLNFLFNFIIPTPSSILNANLILQSFTINTLKNTIHNTQHKCFNMTNIDNKIFKNYVSPY